jgi:hypothetical protein
MVAFHSAAAHSTGQTAHSGLRATSKPKANPQQNPATTVKETCLYLVRLRDYSLSNPGNGFGK